LNLRSGAVATLVENSELVMTDAGDVTLAKGAVVIRNPKAQDARVSVAGASVIVRGDGTFPSICRIASVDRSAVVIADKGHVEIHGAGAPTLVPAGKTVHLENGVPQGGTQPRAGKVAGEIPAAEVTHQGTPTPVPLNLDNTVYWLDTVHTIKNGRARIGLDGGSVLLVGANSTMRIVQHNADTQQTIIELTAGKLRNEVVPQTVPGHKFETRTPTAVIGVVGTTVIVDAQPKVTRVWNTSQSDGGVHDAVVQNANPSVTGNVTLHPGQFTTVRFGLPPTLPITPPGGQINTELSHTNVPPGITAPTSIAAGVSSGATNIGALGATGVSAGLSVAAVSKISGANDSLNGALTGLSDAGSQLNQATTSSNSAANAAGQAASAATQAANIATETATQIQIQIQQGCGCMSPSRPQ
jgi:hypothetical protein